MTQNIRDFVHDSHDLVGLGEPTHGNPAFGHVRNEMFAQLVDRGFRSIAVETDRVAALVVNAFVQHGVGTLDEAMSEGFSHGFGAFDANRHLVASMRAYNEDHAPSERLAFHGIDAPWEFTASSPRHDLEYVRDYLGLDLDIASIVGEDEQWHRNEAVLDPAESPGDSTRAEKLRAIADDMLTSLYARAPELIAQTSHVTWHRARTHLTSALGLLRYHRQAARHISESDRWSNMSATRDAVMAQNLLDIRDIEARRGPTMISAHNLHLQLSPSTMSLSGPDGTWVGVDLTWFGAGAIIASLLGDRYAFIVGRLSQNDESRLSEPDPDTDDGFRHRGFTSWTLTAAHAAESGAAHANRVPEQGSVPLDRATLDGADAVLHVKVGTTQTTSSPDGAESHMSQDGAATSRDAGTSRSGHTGV